MLWRRFGEMRGFFAALRMTTSISAETAFISITAALKML
jgi:hypothetical protein